MPHLMNWLPGMKPPLQTSEGAIKIQLQAALSALGQERVDLNRDQQNQLTAATGSSRFATCPFRRITAGTLPSP
jgi:hypothetical protein